MAFGDEMGEQCYVDMILLFGLRPTPKIFTEVADVAKTIEGLRTRVG